MKLGAITKNLKPAGAAVVGAIGASVLKNKILPATLSPMIKSAIPVVAGLFLMGMKGSFIPNIGLGMVAKSGSDLAVENIPGLAGFIEEDMSGLFDYEVNDYAVNDYAVNDFELNDSPNEGGVNEESY